MLGLKGDCELVRGVTLTGGSRGRWLRQWLALISRNAFSRVDRSLHRPADADIAQRKVRASGCFALASLCTVVVVDAVYDTFK